MTLNNQGETRNPIFVLKEFCSPGFPGKMGSHLHLKFSMMVGERGRFLFYLIRTMSGLIPWDQVVTWEGKGRSRGLF